VLPWGYQLRVWAQSSKSVGLEVQGNVFLLGVGGGEWRTNKRQTAPGDDKLELEADER
jgi:hypothetical protein